MLYKYLLKSIATARSECTIKRENKASYNVTGRATEYIVLDLIDFLVMIEERSKHRLKKEIFIIIKNTVLIKNWFVVSNFCEFTEHHME